MTAAQLLTPSSRWLSVAEVAAALDQSPQTIRRWIASGRLPASRPGREYRVHSDALASVLDDHSDSEQAQLLALIAELIEDGKLPPYTDAHELAAFVALLNRSTTPTSALLTAASIVLVALDTRRLTRS